MVLSPVGSLHPRQPFLYALPQVVAGDSQFWPVYGAPLVLWARPAAALVATWSLHESRAVPLKRLVAELSLEKQVLRDVAQGNF